jgi:mRNA interferase RelE/StbE
LPAALEEWNRLDGSVKEVLRKLLKKRLAAPRMLIPGNCLG